jgi:hypothetical protein
VVNISSAPGTDFMPAAATDAKGSVWVTWVGNRGRNFNIFVASQEGEKFSSPRRVSDTKANEWEPAIAADAKGNVAVAWDTYAKGDYDVYVSRLGIGGEFERPQPVAATLGFEVRPSLAYDAAGRLWIAWEESGDQWGKDFGGLKKKGIPLYQTGRTLAVKALDGNGQWLEVPDVMEAMPSGLAPRRARRGAQAAQPAGAAGFIAPSIPRLATDGNGNVFLAFRGRPGGNMRVAVGSVWFEYVTRLQGGEWADAVWLPRSSNLLDNRPGVVAHDGTLTIIYSGDGRGEMNPPANVPTDKLPRGPRARALEEVNSDIFTANIHAEQFGGEAGELALKPIDPEKPATPTDDTVAEQKAIETMRAYRINMNGETLRIYRGEFHRHTELSQDGGNDGGLLDMWRYAFDAADLDWIGPGDHDYGSGREYSWWTSQKTVTLFTLPKHFIPMFTYERSVTYPEGHRNVMFAKRGIRSLPRLPLSDPEKFAPAPDTNLLYIYLKHFDGVCASHTSATDMGTDWRNWDPEVEPFVEIYQGHRNSYERPESPRSAVTEARLKQSTPEMESFGGYKPKGFINLALKMGYRLAFQASSDHISTNLSYCNVLIPADAEPTRELILEAIKKRRVYGATDDIVADVRCTADGREHLMGEEFTTSKPPTLNVRLIGAHKLAKVVIIKNDEEVHAIEPNEQDVSFTWTDPNPTPGEVSYYYVRGEQVRDTDDATTGELVWASPMWITYQPK